MSIFIFGFLLLSEISKKVTIKKKEKKIYREGQNKNNNRGGGVLCVWILPTCHVVGCVFQLPMEYIFSSRCIILLPCFYGM